MKTTPLLPPFALTLFLVLASAPRIFGQAPIIVTQPANRTVTAGATATFTVVATASPAPTYQWRRNAANIAGATSATYVTPVTTVSDNGSFFSVVVSSGGFSVTSANATLTVNAPPNVDISGPGGVAVGTTATFTTVATAGTPPFTYQWYKNGTLPANLIPGATGSSYTTPPTTLADNGSRYFVRITDASGISVFSEQEELTVFKASQSITFNPPTTGVVSPTPITVSATASSGLPVTIVVEFGPATISGANLTLTGVGTVVLRATQAGDATFESVFVERNIAVSKGTPLIAWTPPASVTDGTILGAAHLTATANVPGTFVYSPASGTLLRSPSQTVTAAFTPTDTTNYNPVSAVRTIVVGTGPVVTGPGSVIAGQTASFSVGAAIGTPPFTYQWLKNGIAIAGATSTTYVTPPTTVESDHNSTFTVRITDSTGAVVTATAATLQVTKAAQTITFTAPIGAVVSPAPVTLSASASSGLPVSFLVLSGPATVAGSSLTLTGVGNVMVRAFQVGSAVYEAAAFVDRTFVVGKGTPVITWSPPASVPDGTSLGAAELNATANVPGSFVYSPPSGTVVRPPSQALNVTFTPADPVNYNNATAQRTLTVGPPPNLARLTNVSVRTALAAAQTLIVGFTMVGGEKAVLVRAVGPTLGGFGISTFMADPRLALFQGNTAVQDNDNWGGGSVLADAFARAGAFALPATSSDAALVRSVDGGHTAQITGTAGTVLVEVYDIGTNPTARLSNVSARNRAGAGNDILIAGFAIEGAGQKALLFRAVGPALAAFGVTAPLADPKLELYSSMGTRIAENDSWNASLAGTFSSVGAFALPSGSRDAALTIALPAGNYTVQVTGADGGAGEALVEVYELP